MSIEIIDVIKRIREYRNNLPFICELKVTELCNMKCSYCYREEKDTFVINEQRVLAFFDELAELYKGRIVCSFHGGEPLIKVDFIEEFMKELSKRTYFGRMAFTIQTNGLLITEDVLKIFEKYHVGVGISLDSVDDNIVEDRKLIDGKGTSKLVRQVIENMRERGISVSTTCVITRRNIKNLPQYIRWCYNNKISMVGFNYLRISDDKNAKLNLLPDVEEYLKITKEVIDVLIELNSKEHNYRLYVLEISNIVNKIVNSYFCSYVCNYPCQAGKRIVCLNTDGRLDCCDCIGNNKINTIGYFEPGNLKELLLIAESKNFALNRDIVEECRNCELSKYCTYACTAENIIYYGEKNIENPGKLCAWYKGIIKYLLSKLEEGISPELFVDTYVGDSIEIVRKED